MGQALLTGTALAFGTIWVAVNAYLLYPLASTAYARYVRGNSPRVRRREPAPEVEAISDGGRRGGPTVAGDTGDDGTAVPTIDLLVPAYDEGEVIGETIRHVMNADYPAPALNVVVLVEPDDHETRAVLSALADRYTFSVVVVPAAYPGEANKPRALNYGFEVTAGDVVGVVDAEDIVDRTVFQAVRRALTEEDYDYVQGKLDMANEDDGWLNTMFRAEYGVWYRLFLEGSWSADYPIPLGGSTNFFRRSVLAAVSDARPTERFFSPEDREWLAAQGLAGALPWDPTNVTEDFELGLYLWREGYDVGFLDRVTREESPLTVRNWLRQRTRWQKGKMYTFRQYLRDPPSGVGTAAHSFAQAALPHLGLVNTLGVLALLVVANAVGYRPPLPVGALLVAGVAFVVVHMGLHAVGYWMVTDTTGWTRRRRTLACFATLFGYWLLQWLADLRALRQIYFGDLRWEKTDHNGEHGMATDGGRIEEHEAL